MTMRRLRRWGVVLVPLGLLSALAVYLAMAADRRYRAAVAETDRLDPGWRYADLEAARAVVPDSENSAPRLLAAAGLITPKYEKLERAVQNLSWTRRVDEPYAPGELAAIRAAVAEGSPALVEARGVAGMPRGRLHVALAKDVVSTSLRQKDRVRDVGRLLMLDARTRAADGDFEGAALSALAHLNAGRAIGDESFAVSQAARGALVSGACDSVNHILTVGELSESTLAAFQAGLEDDASGPPMLLTALRGERAQAVLFFEAAANGDAEFAAITGAAAKPWHRLVYRGQVLVDNQARFLTMINEVVEAARESRPHAFFDDWEKRTRAGFARMNAIERVRTAPVAQLVPNAAFWSHGLRRMEAMHDAAIVTIAAERFRMAERRWPDSYDELRPKYLRRVPVDPFGDGPLRFKRLPNGLVVYSVGFDQTDNDGSRLEYGPPLVGLDFGYRLRDPGIRRPGASGGGL